MLVVVIACVLLIATTTVIHYEALHALNARLPSLAIPSRTKLLVVIFVAFFAHATEMAVYGGALYVLIAHLGAGDLNGPTGFSLMNCLYFSAETYTTLGF